MWPMQSQIYILSWQYTKFDIRIVNVVITNSFEMTTDTIPEDFNMLKAYNFVDIIMTKVFVLVNVL